jgi:hypothetical protein
MSWADQPAADRVQWVAESLNEPKTAHWVANEADVSPATARKYLEKLADERRLRRLENGERTLYSPDHITQYLKEVREVYEDHSADELAQSLDEIRNQLEAWRAEYDVSTPNALRATVATVDRAEAEQRREIAIEWDHVETRLDIIEDALKLYDRFPDDQQVVA